MKVTDKVRIVIYRCHEKGLEVLLIRPELKYDDKVWKLPQGDADTLNNNGSIELQSYSDMEGELVRTYAIEADWHEIPSVRGMIKHDVKRLGKKIKKASSLQSATYLSVKEALKKVLPTEHKLIHELKEVLFDRNQASLI